MTRRPAAAGHSAVHRTLSTRRSDAWSARPAPAASRHPVATVCRRRRRLEPLRGLRPQRRRRLEPL